MFTFDSTISLWLFFLIVALILVMNVTLSILAWIAVRVLI